MQGLNPDVHQILKFYNNSAIADGAGRRCALYAYGNIRRTSSQSLFSTSVK